jgi:hypothetical protein
MTERCEAEDEAPQLDRVRGWLLEPSVGHFGSPAAKMAQTMRWKTEIGTR